ncbi:MAG: DNA-3-methyladenine glycosylase [Calditrichia bacterium]
MSVLTRSFYSRNPEIVARELLGKRLVRELAGQRLSGMIIETEAYRGEKDSASHAYHGKTPRNAVMFGPAGFAYIYFIYGKHYMLNLVTGQEGEPSAVLVRALFPLEGLSLMKKLRGTTAKNLTPGPATICQAMGIDRGLNGWDVTLGQQLWCEEYLHIDEEAIQKGPRIGIPYARPNDRAANLRFWIESDLIFKDGHGKLR